MAVWILGALVGVGILFTLVMALSLRSILRQKPRNAGAAPPFISVLKPLKGIDPNLSDNLHSVFEQDYPGETRVILGTEQLEDPALEFASGIAAKYASRDVIVTYGGSPVGYNPKINNLANLYARAPKSIIVISDSNTRVPPNYLSDLAGHLIEAEGALVWSPFRGTGEHGLGGLLEAVHLNTQVLAGMAGVTKVMKMPCALGKSMMFKAEHLEEIGGFPYLGQFLAEDQIMAEEMAKKKVGVRMSGVVIDNVLGYRSLKDYMGRQLRWARLRRSMKWLGYAAEILLNPTFVALVGLIALRTPAAAAIFGGSLLTVSALTAWMERLVKVKRNLLLYPAIEVVLSTVRGLLWPFGFLSSKVNWRGNILKVGPRSKLLETAPLKKANKVHSTVG